MNILAKVHTLSVRDATDLILNQQINRNVRKVHCRQFGKEEKLKKEEILFAKKFQHFETKVGCRDIKRQSETVIEEG